MERQMSNHHFSSRAKLFRQIWPAYECTDHSNRRARRKHQNSLVRAAAPGGQNELWLPLPAQIDVRAHLSGKSDVQRVRGANPERSGTVIIVGVYPSEPQWIFIVEYEFHFSLNKKTQSKIRTEKLRASVFDRLIDIIGPPQGRFAGQVVNRKSRIP